MVRRILRHVLVAAATSTALWWLLDLGYSLWYRGCLSCMRERPLEAAVWLWGVVVLAVASFVPRRIVAPLVASLGVALLHFASDPLGLYLRWARTGTGARLFRQMGIKGPTYWASLRHEGGGQICWLSPNISNLHPYSPDCGPWVAEILAAWMPWIIPASAVAAWLVYPFARGRRPASPPPSPPAPP